MAPMMEDTPHVRADSAQIEDVVQCFVDERPGRDGVVIAIMRYIQQKERLRQAAYKVEGDKLPRTGPDCIQSNPDAHKDCQTHNDLDPHRTVCLGRNVLVGKKPIEAAT